MFGSLQRIDTTHPGVRGLDFARFIHDKVEETKIHNIFAHSHFAPRNLPSLLQDIHCLSIGQVKPLKHYVLSPWEKL
jgi:hypothetical protein